MISNFIVLRNGLPIITVPIDGKTSLTQDDNKFTLVSGFFQAINSFADSVENLGQVDEIQMTDLLFTFLRKKLDDKENELLFILTTEGFTEKTLRKIIIEEACSTFLYMFGKQITKKWNGDVKPYAKFKKVFLDIIESILNVHEQQKNISANHTFPINTAAIVYSDADLHIPKVPPQVQLQNNSSVNPPGQVSKRFEQYQLLRQMQAQLRATNAVAFTGMKAKPSTHEPLIHNLQQLSRFANAQQTEELPLVNGTHSYWSDPYGPTLVSPLPNSTWGEEISSTSSFPSNQQNHSQAQFAQFYPSPSTPLYQNTQPYNQNPVQQLIPVKQPITAGAFRNHIQDSWIKVLMVAIDGRKTIKNLAELLDKPMKEVIEACDYLESRNYISFK